MNKLNDKEKETIIRVILNTKNKQGGTRPNNLIEIAEDIQFLKEKLGGLEKVSELVGISTNMLNRFLSASKTSPKLKELIENRTLDNINVLHYIKKLTEKEQIFITKNFIEGKINSIDVRAIVPLRKKMIDIPIEEIINKVVKSKTINKYIVLLNNSTSEKSLNRILSKIIDSQDYKILSEPKGRRIEFSESAIKTFRRLASEKRLTLKNFIKSILA